MVTSRRRTWTLLDKQKASQCPNFYLGHLGRIMCIKTQVGQLHIAASTLLGHACDSMVKKQRQGPLKSNGKREGKNFDY